MTNTDTIQPGDVIVIRNSGIGDFDPPMTLTVVVQSISEWDFSRYAYGVAVYATDFEPYEIDGSEIVPGPVHPTGGGIEGEWPVEGAVVIAHNATA